MPMDKLREGGMDLTSILNTKAFCLMTQQQSQGSILVGGFCLRLPHQFIIRNKHCTFVLFRVQQGIFT